MGGSKGGFEERERGVFGGGISLFALFFALFLFFFFWFLEQGGRVVDWFWREWEIEGWIDGWMDGRKAGVGGGLIDELEEQSGAGQDRVVRF